MGRRGLSLVGVAALLVSVGWACHESARGKERDGEATIEKADPMRPRVGGSDAVNTVGSAPAGPAPRPRSLAGSKARCDEGELGGCLDAVELLALRAGPASAVEARGLLERACRHGEVRGCVLLAERLAAGVGGPADVPRALRLAGEACDGGAPAGCHQLGRLKEAHLPAAKNPGNAKAIELYEKACDAGRAEACDELGQVYLGGRGGAPKRPDLAGGWFRRGCELGYDLSCAKAEMPVSRGR